MENSRLLKPLKIGGVEVRHRIAMAPLTRLRATDDRVPTPLMKEYYGQRASVPGTLIISEGTMVSPAGTGGFANAPGIWSEEQMAAWKTITDEVHSKGSVIVCQLFATGRAATDNVASRDGVEIIGPSAIPINESSPTPRPMARAEIALMVQDFATASANAMRAGFDGVECHGANGYLLDQFIQDTANQRTDGYGGSVENRSRFIVEATKAMIDTVGADRVGLRLSPWSQFQGMGMADPIPQFSDIIVKAKALDLAYLHLIEARVAGGDDAGLAHSLEFALDLWDGPLLIAGGYTSTEAQKLVDETYPDRDIVVVFGRHFLANPDLVYRMQHGLVYNPYQRDTFYLAKSPVGYVDYPFSAEFLAATQEATQA